MEKLSKIVFLIITILFSTSYLASAIIITEIMHDPESSDTDREWVEVYNDGTTSIDFSSYKFFEANTNHGLISHQGGNQIGASEYAVIVDNPIKFLTDNPGYTGIIFDSSFSLSNTGEFLAIKDSGGTTKDSLTYSGALGGENDGSSLSLVGGAWSKGKSTPGRVNEPFTSVTTPSTQGLQDSATFTLPASPSVPSSDMSLIVSEDKIVIAGADSEFKVRAVNSARKNLDNVEYEWSFGDGGTRKGKSVMYHYSYPGIYISVVEARGETGLALAKTRIRVIPPEIKITNIGSEGNKNFIELKNEGKFEVDLSGWKVDVNGGYYPFPKNTFILPSASIKFTGEAMGFAYATVTLDSKVRLLFPNLNEVTRYEKNINEVNPASVPIVRGVSKTNDIKREKTEQKNLVSKTEVEIKKENTVNQSSTTIPALVSKRDRGIALWFKSIFQKK